MADETNYVTQADWLRPVGRPDLVDEIADQFERPPAAGTQWPRRSRGWRPESRLHLARERVER